MPQPVAGERIVFSVLFNESASFLTLLISNFELHAPADATLMVNVGFGRHDAEYLRELSAGFERVVIVEGDKRSKWGHTLLTGHLESFNAAQDSLGEFDYFCTLASNSLFFRSFDWSAVKAEMDRDKHLEIHTLPDVPDGWQWQSIIQTPKLMSALETANVDRVAWAQTEGFIMSRKNWLSVARHRNSLIEAGASIAEGINISFEEFIPLSFSISLGDGRFANISHNLWSKYLETGDGNATIADLGNKYPSHISVMKWFERDKLSPETLAVSTSAGGSVLDAICTMGSQFNVGFLGLFSLATQTIEKSINGRGVFSGWRDRDLEHLSNGIVTDTRGVYWEYSLSERSEALKRSRCYLFGEESGNSRKIWVKLIGHSTIKISCNPIAGPSSANCEAYLFIHVGRWKAASPSVRLRFSGALGEAFKKKRALINIAQGTSHEPKHTLVSKPAFTHDDAHYYGLPAMGKNTDEIYVGIPCFDGESMVRFELVE